MSTPTTITEKEWFVGRMLLEQLLQHNEQVDPVRVGKAYYHAPQLTQKIIDTVKELAPHGVGSQGEYLDILEQALNSAVKDYKEETGDGAELADLDLSLSYIERKLRNIPFQVVFAGA